MCINPPSPIFFHLQRPLFLQPLHSLLHCRSPLYFISFHHPFEQKCMEEIPQALIVNHYESQCLEQDHSCSKKQITRWWPHNADLRTRCSGNVAECVVINCAEIYGLHKVLSMPFMCALWQRCTSACVPFEWPGVPGRFLSGYSESPDGLMCLISRSHKPLWTSSAGPLRLVPGESGNSQCSLRGAKWWHTSWKWRITFYNVSLFCFNFKVVWHYDSRSGGQYQPSDVAQF